MSILTVIKKFLPENIKKLIKTQLKNTNDNTSTEYIVKVSDINILAGKRVIVTGATGAIGSAICHQLLIRGAIVGVCGRNDKKVNAIIERFEKEKLPGNGYAEPIIMDVTDDISVEKAITQFTSKFGGLDVIVNNAGGSARENRSLFYNQEISVIDNVINTNMRGTIICSRYAAPIMVRQGTGKIINIASVIGMQGMSYMTEYAAAKAGIIGFTKSLALEMGQYGITVNCISPGMVNQVSFDAGLAVKKTETNVLKRYGYTDEVASLVVYIISDEADYITGHNFVIDGGRSLGLMGSK